MAYNGMNKEISDMRNEIDKILGELVRKEISEAQAIDKLFSLFNVNKLVTVEYYKAYYGGYTKAVKHHKENNYCQSKYGIGQCFEAWINAPENRHLKG